MGHELKYGFTYRETGVDSQSSWPGNGNYGDLPDFGEPVAALTRPALASVGLQYWSGYLSDTLTLGNLTLNAGVRYDVQEGNLRGVSIPSNPVVPDILPGITTTDSAAPFKWENFVPRLGATYALGQDQKTLLRASYSQYADQLGSGTPSPSPTPARSRPSSSRGTTPTATTSSRATRSTSRGSSTSTVWIPPTPVPRSRPT